MPLPWQSTGGTGIIPDLPSSARTVCRLVALNSLLLGVLKINLIRKFYTFLNIQINIILHYCVLRMWQFDWRGCSPAAHSLKPPLIKMPRYCSVFTFQSNYVTETQNILTFSLPKDGSCHNTWLRNIRTDFSKLKIPLYKTFEYFYSSRIERKCYKNYELWLYTKQISIFILMVP